MASCFDISTFVSPPNKPYVRPKGKQILKRFYSRYLLNNLKHLLHSDFESSAYQPEWEIKFCHNVKISLKIVEQKLKLIGLVAVFFKT